MASRRHIPPAYEGRSVQASAITHNGPLPASYHPLEPLPRLELLENKLAVQEAEINRLAGDNHKLAATHVALRQDFVTARQEIQKVKEHIRNIQTESDVQIRVLLDKIAKMEADIKAGERVKKDLQEAHIELRSLVAARCDLSSKIQLASQELDNARADVKMLPEMLAEIDSLREEHQRLRKTFEYEKGSNTEKVEQMRIMEEDLVGMAREVERLRTEVSNAERRTHAPNLYNGPYMNPDSLYPPPMHCSGGYVDHYNGPYAQLGVGSVVEGRVQYGSIIGVAAPGGVGGAGGTNVSGSSAYKGGHHTTHAPR